MVDPKTRTWLLVEQKELVHAARTAIAAVVSLLIARWFRLPEAYWAAIATLIATQSTLGVGMGHLEGSPGRDCARRRRGSAAGNLCRRKRGCVRRGGVRAGIALRTPARPASRISLRRNHAGYRHADRAHGASLDRRRSSILRDFGRTRGGFDRDCSLAGARAGSGLKPLLRLALRPRCNNRWSVGTDDGLLRLFLLLFPNFASVSVFVSHTGNCATSTP